MASFADKKYRTYFKRMDYDKDGVITRKDFEAMAERFIAAGKFDDARAAELRTTLAACWDKYLKDMANQDQITEADFIGNLKKVAADSSHHAALAGPLPLFFQCIDSNADGMIDLGEYVNFFVILGVENPEPLATASFKAIDQNNDGLLSIDEFTEAGLEFFTNITDEGKASKMFFGPLVE